MTPPLKPELAEQGKVEETIVTKTTTPGVNEGLSKDDLLKIVRNQKLALEAMNTKVNNLSGQVTEVKEKVDVEPEPDVTETAAGFYKDPVSTIDKMLTDRLTAAVAPLNRAAASIQSDRSYPSLKADLATTIPYMNNPEFVSALDGYVSGGHIDLSNPETAGENLKQFVTGLVGHAAMGTINIKGITPGTELETKEEVKEETKVMPTQSQDGLTGTDRITPPYVPGSSDFAGKTHVASDAKLPSNEEILGSADENLRRVISESGMTPQQWYQFDQLDPEDVATSMIGIEEKK